MAQSNTLFASKPPEDRRGSAFRVGQRVSRKDSSEQGTVTETKRKTKVKWDGGRTSYFEDGKPANVRSQDDQER